MQALILNAMKKCGEDDAHKVVHDWKVESEQHESVRVKAKHTMQKELLVYDLNNDPLQAHGCQSLGRVDGR